MDVNLHLIKFCGMFDFDDTQKKKLLRSNTFSLKQITQENDALSWSYIHDQYYPSFRRFISNESSGIDDFKILTNNSDISQQTYLKKWKDAGGLQHDVSFSIRNIEIFLFDRSPGIVSLEIFSNNSNPDLNEISGFINQLRNYSSRFFEEDTQTEIDMLTFIEDRVLNNAAGEDIFSLSGNSKVAEFRGSKLKVFQCFDFEPHTGQDLTPLLFELGTLSPIGSTSGAKAHATHSQQYYAQIIKDSISVYNNWTALCLFDTFSMVGCDYLTSNMTLKTWKENYFRIYVYSLYYKYYLFSINSEGLHHRARLKKQREVLNEFIRIYDTPYISYNFLPNLIHEKIRAGMEVGNETEKLRDKIDWMTGLINEKSNSLTNVILFFVTLMAIVPGNMKDLYDNGQFNTGNLVALAVKILLLLIVWLIYSRVIRKSIKYFRSFKKDLP